MTDTTYPDATITAVDALLAARGWTVTDLATAKGADLRPVRQCLNIRQSCDQLGGITRQMLHGLTRDGKITAVKIGRRTMYEQTEIDRFIASARREITP